MARWLWTIHIGLTAVETLLLVGGGMSGFDAVCHAFATTATGWGFSTKQASVAYWNSPYIEYVISIYDSVWRRFSLYYLAAMRVSFAIYGKMKNYAGF